MAFLTVNAFPLAVADGTFTETPREIGGVSTAFSGAVRKSRRAFKHDIALETVPLIPTEAYAWELLLSGQGDYWPFDTNLYSTKGTGPVSSNGTITTTGGKYGGYLQLGGVDTVLPAGLGALWSYLAWRNVGGGFASFVETSAGAKWLGGVRNDAGVTNTWFSVSGGNLTLKVASGAHYDDVVALPFVIPDAWGPLWHTAGAAFGAFPFVRLAGDGILEGARTMLPSVTDIRVARGTVNGAFYPNLRVLSIEFMEV
jgi:hypothetical protein